MAKKRVFGIDTIPWDFEQYRRTEGAVRKIDAIYKAAIEEAVSLGLQTKRRVSEDVPFSFDALPQTKERINKLLRSFASKMKLIIGEAQGDAWEYAAQKNDALLDSLFRSTKIPRDVIERYKDRNLDALTSFQERKVNGLGLSERVWKQAEQFKQEMEMSLDMGLGEGKSAAQLSRDVREYLNEPDRLFRRVRDKRGNLHLSKNAKAYHPGQGNYRSSYKNAMRVTRSEVNMAYRESDYTRWQQLDFIVGFEVRLSNNHPVTDICDRLAGKYPKDFKFTSWHPHCRCHVIPILATDKEIAELERKLLNEEELGGFRSKNEVKDVPVNFKGWISDNREKIDRAKSKPYFITDNLNERLEFVSR